MPPENGTPIGAAESWTASQRRSSAVDRLDVPAADLVEVRGQRPTRRIEEPPVYRVGIGAPDESQHRDVVRRHHARVAGVELPRPTPPRQFGCNLIDTLGHDERRPVDRLGQEVAQRPVQAPRQHDALPVLRHQRERAVQIRAPR